MDLNTGQEVHLAHYWNVVYKRWKVASSILVVVMLGTFLASYFSKPLYRSAVVLQIERENPNTLTVDDLLGIQLSDQEFMQTQFMILKSRGLAERVIKEHKLLADPDFYPPGINGKSKEEIQKLTLAEVPALLAGIEVKPIPNTYLVEVGYIGGTPRLAQKVAEAVADSYIRMNIEKKLDATVQARDFLTTQIAELKTDLGTAQQQLNAYGESKDIITPADAGSMTVQKLGLANADLHSATNDRIAKETAYQTLLRATPESVAGNDPQVLHLADEEGRLQREYAQKANIYRPEHPDMVALRAQIDKMHQSRLAAIQSAYAKARDEARNAVLTAQAREAGMRTAYEQQKQDTLKLNASAFTYTDLRSAIENKRAMLDQLTKRLDETEVSARLRGTNTSNIHLMDHAELPSGRFNVTIKKNLQNAFPLGVILGLATIFFLEYMDRSIKTTEELERVTGFASLGVIPSAASIGREYGGYQYSYAYGRRSSHAKQEKKKDEPEKPVEIELIPYRNSRAPISESYRAFRTSLLLASAASPKTIVITSTFAREGKTTTATNLATVLAQMGKPVVLIDADLRRPRLQKVFREKMNLGLVNYLAANIAISDVIQETEVPNLSIVLAGPTPPNPSELLASDRMKHLIQDLRSRFAYVIFDSPPVMAVTDAIVLAANADGVVLCVHGGQTPRDIVQRAAERLRQANITVLGAILNNLDLEQYGYTYKKRYYDYYDTDKPGESAKSA